jgi:hypothetical protein
LPSTDYFTSISYNKNEKITTFEEGKGRAKTDYGNGWWIFILWKRGRSGPEKSKIFMKREK